MNQKRIVDAARFWFKNRGWISADQVCRDFNVSKDKMTLAAKEFILSDACVSGYPVDRLSKPVFDRDEVRSIGVETDVSLYINLIFDLYKGKNPDTYFIE
jgi:hypothetical protein